MSTVAWLHLPHHSLETLRNGLPDDARPDPDQPTQTNTSHLWRSVLPNNTDAFVQVLRLSTHAEKAFSLSSSPPAPAAGKALVGATITMTESSATEFETLMRAKLAALWAPNRIEKLVSEGRTWVFRHESFAALDGDVDMKDAQGPAEVLLTLADLKAAAMNREFGCVLLVKDCQPSLSMEAGVKSPIVRSAEALLGRLGIEAQIATAENEIEAWGAALRKAAASSTAMAPATIVAASTPASTAAPAPAPATEALK